MAVYRDLSHGMGVALPLALKQEVIDAVSSGELLVLPTDTVYGIGSDAFSVDAVRRLLNAKGRDQTMPPPILGANAEELLSLVEFTSSSQERTVRALAEAFWPGAMTLVVKSGIQPGWDMSAVGGSIAVRVPHSDEALAVLRATGPLAVTSANRTGMPPARSVAEARAYFGSEVAVYVDGGLSHGSAPSTIVDCTGEELRVIRIGDIPAQRILERAASTGRPLG